MDEVRQYYKFRPDEIFRRVTITSLLSLMLEVAKLEIHEADVAEQQKAYDELSFLDDADSAIGNGDDEEEEEEEEEDEGGTLVAGSVSGSGETSQQYWGSSLNESFGYFRTDSSES
jgi:hypothetical protein